MDSYTFCVTVVQMFAKNVFLPEKPTSNWNLPVYWGKNVPGTFSYTR